MIDAITQNFVAVLENGGLTGEPCDEWQVQDLEQLLGVELPAAYKAFLLLAGQGYGPFEGSHYAYEDDLAELQRTGQNIFRRDRAALPSGAFVFLVHQGFAVRFFLLDGGDDPPVFEYIEHRPPAKELAPRFSEFLLQLGQGRNEP